MVYPAAAPRADDPILDAAAFALWRVQSHPLVTETDWQRLPDVVRGFYRRQARYTRETARLHT